MRMSSCFLVTFKCNLNQTIIMGQQQSLKIGKLLVMWRKWSLRETVQLHKDWKQTFWIHQKKNKIQEIISQLRLYPKHSSY